MKCLEGLEIFYGSFRGCDGVGVFEPQALASECQKKGVTNPVPA
jgi:hypothetical protein